MHGEGPTFNPYKRINAGQIPYGLSQHMLPVPVYRVGSNLIKADQNLTQSVLASSLWQYWQRGFCASFPLPLSVQRVLPSDAPLLQAGDGSISDFHRNRQLLNFRTLDSWKVGRYHNYHLMMEVAYISPIGVWFSTPILFFCFVSVLPAHDVTMTCNILIR